MQQNAQLLLPKVGAKVQQIYLHLNFCLLTHVGAHLYDFLGHSEYYKRALALHCCPTLGYGEKKTKKKLANSSWPVDLIFVKIWDAACVDLHISH